MCVHQKKSAPYKECTLIYLFITTFLPSWIYTPGCKVLELSTRTPDRVYVAFGEGPFVDVSMLFIAVNEPRSTSLKSPERPFGTFSQHVFIGMSLFSVNAPVASSVKIRFLSASTPSTRILLALNSTYAS